MDKRLEVYDTVSDLVIADYGTFPIWHRETDLKLMDLQNGQIDSLPTINSDRSDTYHSWSSNSRWFVFASKRGDGQYGKPYFAYISPDGTAGKPFVLLPKRSGTLRLYIQIIQYSGAILHTCTLRRLRYMPDISGTRVIKQIPSVHIFIFITIFAFAHTVFNITYHDNRSFQRKVASIH